VLLIVPPWVAASFCSPCHRLQDSACPRPPSEPPHRALTMERQRGLCAWPLTNCPQPPSWTLPERGPLQRPVPPHGSHAHAEPGDLIYFKAHVRDRAKLKPNSKQMKTSPGPRRIYTKREECWQNMKVDLCRFEELGGAKRRGL
jgi:hypothetical protein